MYAVDWKGSTPCRGSLELFSLNSPHQFPNSTELLISVIWAEQRPGNHSSCSQLNASPTPNRAAISAATHSEVTCRVGQLKFLQPALGQSTAALCLTQGLPSVPRPIHLIREHFPIFGHPAFSLPHTVNRTEVQHHSEKNGGLQCSQSV